MAETITAEVLAKVYGTRDVSKLGDEFAKTAGTAAAAAASLKVWNDTAAKGAKADGTLVQAKQAGAKADKLWADALNVLNGKQTQFIKLQADTGRALDDTAKKAAAAAGSSGLGALIGGGGLAGGGMGALYAAGVALAPVIASVGTGIGGLGIAAAGIAKPIQKAAQATGGLQANMHKLNPEQQQVARGILALGKQFAGFQADLQPTVLGDFSKGLTLAGHLLHDIEPVAAATGKAFGGLLGQIDATFASRAWQGLFAFMARTAGPDITLLGRNFTDLAMALPPLLEQLQPVATDLLNITDAAAKLTGWLAKSSQSLDATGQHMNTLQHVTSTLRTLLFAPGAGLLAALKLLHLTGGDAAKGIASLVTPAQSAAAELQAMAAATTNLMTAQQKALTAQTTYAGDLVTAANDATALEKALDKSRNEIGLHTAAQRNSFAAANTYITDLGNTATAAYDSGHGVDASISAIKRGLPLLDQAKTKNREYWQEVQTLVGWLHKLELIKAIKETVFVSGNGTFTIRPGTSLGLPGGTAGGPFATGGKVPPGFPNDTYLARVTSGEAIVDPVRTKALAPMLGAAGVPGFAAGGLVGSYRGDVAGLVPWSRHDLNATVGIFEQAIAKATLTGIRTAAAAIPSGRGGLGIAERAWVGAGGPGGLAAHIAGAIAGAESGWTMAIQKGQPYATTGWGPWQITPGNSEPQFGTDYALLNWRSNALAAVAKYQQAGSSFSPWTTFNDGAYLQFMDRGGWLKPGLNHVYNGTGRPEQVIPSRGSGSGATVNNYITVQVGHGTHPVQAAKEIADVLNTGARSGVRLRTSILGPG